MRPAFSVIWFTVLSGAGFGLLACAGLWALFDSSADNLLFPVASVTGFVLAASGLLSSLLHLGHPERAWRALSQWRSSWLSREGVLAVATLAMTAAGLLIWALSPEFLAVFGLAVALLSAVTVVSTSMIYRQLRTVPLWYRSSTVWCYLAFAGGSGLYLFVTAATSMNQLPSSGFGLLLVLLVLATALRIYWRFAFDPTDEPSVGDATGLSEGNNVRLLESPHSGASYLTDEMGFRIARKHSARLNLIAVVSGLVIPGALVVIAWSGHHPAFWLIAGMPFLFTGLIIERWLFFAEARHLVTLYYRRQQETG